MKMAKATDQEIDGAIRLARLTESVCRPKNFVSPQFSTDEKESEYFDEDDPKDLRKFYDRVKTLSGGLMRVTMGYQVLVTNMCDPSKDTIEWRPATMTPNA